MRRLIRWVSRALIGLLALIMAAISLLLITQIGRDLVRDGVERALGDVFVGHLELGTIESLWLTHARISGAVLTDGQGREAIRVGPVEVQFAPLELLHQRVLVRSVTIRRPVVEMVVDEKGALNLAALVRPTATSAAEPSRAGTPWTILVDSASVSAGRVQLVTPTSTRELDRIALGGRFRMQGPHLEVRSARLDLLGRPALRGARLDLDLDSGALDVRADAILEPELIRALTLIEGVPAGAHLQLSLTRTRSSASWTARATGRAAGAAVTLSATAAPDFTSALEGRLTVGGLDAVSATVTAHGPLGLLDVSADLALRGPAFRGVSARTLELHGALRGVPDAASGTVSVASRGLRIGGEPLGDVRLTARVFASGRQATLEIAQKRGRTLESLQGVVRIAWDAGDLRLSVPSLVAVTKRARWRVEDARFRRAADGSLFIQQLVVESKRGCLTVDAELNREPLLGRGWLKAAIKDLDLAYLRRELAGGLPALSGLLQATVDARFGTIEAAKIDAFVDDLRTPGAKRPLRARAELRLLRRVLTASASLEGATLGHLALAAKLRAPRHAYAAEGWVSGGLGSVEQLEVVLGQVSLSRLDEFGLLLGFQGGTASGRMVASSGLRSLELEVGARGVRHRDLPGPLAIDLSSAIDEAGTSVQLSAEIAAQRLLQGRAHFEADVARWLRDPSEVLQRANADAKVSLREFPLTLVEDIRVDPPGIRVSRKKSSFWGELNAEAQLTRRGGHYQGGFDARGSELSWVEGMPRVTATVALALNDTTIQLGGYLHGPKLGRASLEATGEAPVDLMDLEAWKALGLGAIKLLQLKTEVFDLSVVDRLTDGRLALDGVATTDISVRDGLRTADARVKVRRFGRHGSDVLTDATLQLKGRPQQTRIELQIAEGTRLVLSATASVPLGLRQALKVDLRGTPLEARAKLDRLSLQTIAAALGSDVPMGGTITGTLALEGTSTNYHVAAYLDASGATVKDQAFSRFVAEGTLDPGRLALKVGVKEKTGPGSLDLHANVDRAKGGVLDATLKAFRLRIDFLSAFFQRQRSIGGIAGTLDADVRLQGTPDNPAGEGKLSLSGLALVLASPIPPIESTTVEATLSGQKITANFQGRSGEGRLSGTIDAVLTTLGTPSFDVALETQDLPVVLGPRQGLIASKVRAQGAVGPELKVDVTIQSAQVHIPNASGASPRSVRDFSDVVYIDDARRARLGTNSSTETAALPLLITVKSQKPIPVKGTEIAAEATVDLTLDGRSGVVEGSGKVTVGSGWINLFGRRWEVEHGQLTLLGRASPEVEVEIRRDLGTAVAIVRVRGNLAKPELELSSDPPIFDEAQVLMFVLGAEPGSGDEAVSLQDRAAGAAAGALVGALQSKLEDKLPIDTIKVDVKDGAKISRVTVGKWITDRIFIGYDYSFGAKDDENANEGVVEVRLGRGWILESRYGDRGEGSLDFVWVRRF